MASRIAHLLSIAFVAAAAAGCASAPARFYTLDSTATADGAPAARYAVIVGPVSVPASVDRPEFVVQVAPNRVERRRVQPLGGAAERQHRARRRRRPRGAARDAATWPSAPLANFNPAYRVTIDVQRFESIPGEAVLIDAVWAVRQTAGGDTRSGRTVAREAVQGEGFDALAAAHSRALATVSGDIAAAIRAQAGGGR